MRMPLAALAVVGSATAERLICASYGNDTSPGIVASLELSCDGASRKLEVVSQNKECGALPTWLDTTLSPTTVVCLDEAATNAALTTFNLESDGTLKKTSSVPSLGGAVAMATYNNNTALALAHFGPPAISTYKVHPPMPFQNLQNITFSAPDEIHQAVLDPTGQYMVFPSRSADLVHVYLVDPRTAQLTVRESLKAKKGYGPRHAVFWTGGSAGATYLFVVHEFSNRIVSYKVDYLAQNGGLNFTEVDDVSTYGNRTVPDKTFASEIVVSPCNSFVLAANRNGTVFTVDAKNGTKIPSDSIVTYKPTPEGKLSYVQLANSGGFFPRHFNLNKDGSMIAVANQKSQSVVIYERDVQTGLIRDDKVVASVDGLGPGDLMYVQWV